MTSEQAVRMASAQSNTRELRLLKAVEGVAGELGRIAYSLSMIEARLQADYEERCGDRIGTMSVPETPPVKVDVECS
jgi:hypothetical protein